MRLTLTIAVALIGGIIGGIGTVLVMHFREGPSVPAQVLRAHSFELMDPSGHIISYWGTDSQGNIMLAFGNRIGRANPSSQLDPKDPKDQMTAIGLQKNGLPILEMSALEGQTRLRMYLNPYGKPLLLMEDETGPRISLGVEQSDTPGPQDNDWFLSFYPDRARIGMFTQSVGGRTYVKGGVAIHENNVKYP